MTTKKPNGFFITGTGTDVGKTYVSRILVDTFSLSGPATYFKPIQTGCVQDKRDFLHAPDFEYLKTSSMQMPAAYEIHVPYRFKPACSPHLAARLAGAKISLPHIKQCFVALAKKNTLVITEGAGGLMVPLGPSNYMIDLIAYLGLPVILVTSPALGTLNHTFLSLAALKQRGVALAGIVYNNSHNSKQNFIYKDNRESIKRTISQTAFVEIKYNCNPNKELESFCNELRAKYL